MPEIVIEIEQLRYAWPQRGTGTGRNCVAIEQLSLAAGSTTFLHGPSGCGKSTLLGLLAGVLLPQQGSVRLLGRGWNAMSSAGRDGFRADHVGYIFQQFNLLPYLNPIDNVLLPCRFSALRQQRAAQAHGSARAAAESLLRRVGLPAVRWAARASELSVGQQQRVAAARALIGAPEVVIADEPTSSLDAALREDFMNLLLGACRSAAGTLVFVSHDERLADRFETRISLPAINRAAEVSA